MVLEALMFQGFQILLVVPAVLVVLFLLEFPEVLVVQMGRQVRQVRLTLVHLSHRECRGYHSLQVCLFVLMVQDFRVVQVVLALQEALKVLGFLVRLFETVVQVVRFLLGVLARLPDQLVQAIQMDLVDLGVLAVRPILVILMCRGFQQIQALL